MFSEVQRVTLNGLIERWNRADRKALLKNKIMYYKQKTKTKRIYTKEITCSTTFCYNTEQHAKYFDIYINLIKKSMFLKHSKGIFNFLEVSGVSLLTEKSKNLEFLLFLLNSTREKTSELVCLSHIITHQVFSTAKSFMQLLFYETIC